ncbi:MAG TPA: MarR family transcriptional regulator [Gammaproteobacteria bacterium]
MTAQRQFESHARGEIAAQLHDQFSRLSRQLRNMDLPNGMTPERLSALSVIEKYGPISVTALADKEMVRPATMSRMVSALVDEGLVRRHEDREDGRGVLVTATPKGRRAYQRAHQLRLQRFIEALERLTPEQLAAMRGLASALERFTSVLDDQHRS